MDKEPPQPRISPGFVVVFYALLGGLAVFLASFWGDLNLLVWHDTNETPVALDAALGVGLGLLVVLASGLLDKHAEWARRLGREFGKVLGPIGTTDAFIFAVASGVGEELLFRGFLQQLLSVSAFSGDYAEVLGLVTASVLFGMLHVGPNLKTFWPWTAMAVVLGVAFGAMYLYTGNLLAPILAHFTINFFNLQSIGQKYGHLQNADES